jgi:site-specific DNA-methyltransferase (adenine-specific)
MGSFPHPRNGLITIDYEFILLFKKLGTYPNNVSAEVKEKSKLSKEEWRRYFTGHWNFAGQKQGEGHIAMFPEELPNRLIKMFSFVGETVLDPFLGSGTTTKVANILDRSSIGYEINEEYLPIIKDKAGIDKSSLFDLGNKFEIRYQKTNNHESDQKKKISNTNSLINQRINHPDYWKILRTKKEVGI